MNFILLASYALVLQEEFHNKTSDSIGRAAPLSPPAASVTVATDIRGSSSRMLDLQKTFTQEN